MITSATTQPPVAAAPQMSPQVAIERDAEQRLTTDALSRLDAPQVAADAERMASRPGHIGVPVGTVVYTKGDEQGWSVIGVDDSGALNVARRTVAGEIERSQGSFASFAQHSAELLSSPAVYDGLRGASMAGVDGPFLKVPRKELVPTAAAYENVAAFGPESPVTLADAQVYGNKFAAQLGVPTEGVETNWRQVLANRDVDSLTPVLVAPDDAGDVVSLRSLIGDTRMVVSNTGSHEELRHISMTAPDQESAVKALLGPKAERQRLIATESMPDAARGALFNVTEDEAWFSAKAGVKLLPGGTQLTIHTNEPDYLANAAASKDGSGVQLYEGPRDPALREEWLLDADATDALVAEQMKQPDLAGSTRKGSEIIQKHIAAVRAHELGHALQGEGWLEPFNGGQVTQPEQLLLSAEHGVAREAISDLWGAARSGSPDMGVRHSDHLDEGGRTLEELQTGIYLAVAQGQPFDEHFGTQLITKPAMNILRLHGADGLAEVTGIADRALSRAMSNGEISVVDLTTAANAVYAASASRFGANDTATIATRLGYEELGFELAELA